MRQPTNRSIIAWQDTRVDDTWDIFAQRVNSNGTLAWTNDVVICTGTGEQRDPQLVEDGSGGAIVVWQDNFEDAWDIYAQGVDASGTVWQFCGRVVCSYSQDQEKPQIATDGQGGAIVAWKDDRNLATTGWDVYAQRLNSSGNRLWNTNGVALCTYYETQEYLAIASDGASGAVVAWQDYRSTAYFDIYAQRVDSSGSAKWGTGGLKVCTAANEQIAVKVASSGLGGAIIGWQDNRNEPPQAQDIYAQRMVDPASDVNLPLVAKRE